MTINRVLLWWQCRQLLPATLIAAPLSLAYVLLSPGLLLWQSDYLAFFFIVLHGFWLVMSVGRPTNGQVAYLYSHGFDRDTLWKHTVLATASGAAVVWIPVAVCIWGPIRTALQSTRFENAEFSLMAPLETPYPWFVLLAYVAWIPMMHYAWIREGQPFRGGNSGTLLAAAFVMTSLVIGKTAPLRQAPPWMIQAYIGCAILLSVLLLVVGRRLHRDLEVRA